MFTSNIPSQFLKNPRYLAPFSPQLLNKYRLNKDIEI